MKRRWTKQVDPRAAGIAILVVLIVVQFVWWRGLVYNPRARGGGGGPSAGGGGAPDLNAYGREDIFVDTIAGDSDAGDRDGPGRDARFDGPSGLAVDAAGNLYVADCRNNRIRRVTAAGRTSTVAGGAVGFEDGPVARARFNAPSGVAVAPDGTIYVADTGNGRVRAISGGVVRTVSGGPSDRPTAVACQIGPDGKTVVWAADAAHNLVMPVSPPGSPISVSGVPTCLIAVPAVAVAVPGKGTITIAGASRSDVVIDTKGQAADVKKGGYRLHSPTSLCAWQDGWLAADSGHGAIFMLRGAGRAGWLTAASGHGPSDEAAEIVAGEVQPREPVLGLMDGNGQQARFGSIAGMVGDNRGNVYVADTANNAIRRLRTIVPEQTRRGRARD